MAVRDMVRIYFEIGVFQLRRFVGLAGVLLLMGCSTLTMVNDYNKDLTDYTGDKKIGVAFNIQDNQARVYPETKSCIDLYSKNNGFVPVGFIDNNAWSDGKKIGIPEVDGMSKRRQEFWVNASDNLAVRVLYTGKTGATNIFSPKVAVAESIIVFKPEAGAFYYVTVDFEHQDPKTGKYLRIYKIVDNGDGKKDLKHVEMLNIHNCPGQQPWYTKMGAVI
ncbi:putative lipoprotein [Brenneria sp. EniD312]|nr:putative lipoprotein [Brenneria sp. EniD312]